MGSKSEAADNLLSVSHWCVAQVFNLPYRRLSVGQALGFRSRRRLEVCHTAARRSALRRLSAGRAKGRLKASIPEQPTHRHGR